MLSLAKLPVLNPDKVTLSEGLRRLLGTVNIQVPDSALRISDFTECTRRPIQAPVEFLIDCAYGCIAVTVARTTIDAFLDAVLPDWRNEADMILPFEWTAILAFELLSRGSPLAMAGLRLQFVPQTPDDAPRFDGTMMMLNTPQQLSVAVLAARPNFPIPSPVSQFSLHSLPLHLPSCLDVSFGALEFSMSELRGLAKGDVLLLRESDIELLPAQLRINAHAVWSGSLTTTGSFKAIAPERETSVMTTDDEITAGSVSVQVDDATTLPMLEADRSASDLIDLPMLVDFQFHRKTMALSEISSIAPGAILDLGLDLSDPIVIRINEKAVGTGRLIQIGDRVGIQIERWTDETKRAWS